MSRYGQAVFDGTLKYRPRQIMRNLTSDWNEQRGGFGFAHDAPARRAAVRAIAISCPTVIGPTACGGGIHGSVQGSIVKPWPSTCEALETLIRCICGEVVASLR